jgi:hypothetical protein
MYENSGSTVVICYSPDSVHPPGSSFLDTMYMLKYRATPKAKLTALVDEGEMMTTGMLVENKNNKIVAKLYWPSDQFHRQTEQITFSCNGSCIMTKRCQIARLPSDLKTDELFKIVQPSLKTEDTRANFVMSGNAKDQMHMNQLFAEAATGNTRALALLENLGEGADAAAGEVGESFIETAREFSQKKKCTWKSDE